ncbi:MAG: hypothetical protein WKF73_08375 [Nocardioidaceae bacterium]
MPDWLRQAEHPDPRGRLGRRRTPGRQARRCHPESRWSTADGVAMTILQPYTKMASQGVGGADLRQARAEPRIRRTRTRCQAVPGDAPPPPRRSS